MTKLVIISDTHGLTPKLPDGDILIHCGDLTNFGTFTQMSNSIQWLKNQSHEYKICIAGNHDFILQQSDCSDLFADSGIHYLEDKLVEIKGLNIYGSPWTPTFMDWAFMKDRGEPIRQMWDKIPNNLDVLITHGPPWGILDLSIYTNKSVGCVDLLSKVLKVKPKIHCFGHIHYCYGIKERKHTKFINAAQLNEKYKIANKPIEIYL